MPKIAVYTALFGGYDQLLMPLHRSPNCDYFCFTDDPALTSDFWQIRLLSPAPDPQRQSREPKIRPHHYFPDYDASLYLDANLLLIGDVDDYIARYQRHSPLLLVKHSERDCLYEELHACLEGRSDDPGTMIRQVERYRQEGFPAHFGLAVGSFLYREHNSPRVIDLMELWWQELNSGSKRDQLSLSYCLWKQNIQPDIYYGNNWNNDYFVWLPHRIQSNPYLTPASIQQTQPDLLLRDPQRLMATPERQLDQRSLMPAKFYIDQGQGFSESHVIFVPPSRIKGENHYILNLPANTQAVRFDPIEGDYCLIDNPKAQVNGSPFTLTPANGTIAASGTTPANSSTPDTLHIFKTTDPIYLIQTGQLIEQIEISLRMTVITDKLIKKGF